LILVALLLTIPLLAACGDDDKDKTPTKTTPVATTPTKTTPAGTTPAQKVKISLGLLTDKTGPAASALNPVDQALRDVIRYFGEQNFIPTAEFKLEEYDTAYDPAKVKPGYEFLKEKGAKAMCGGVPMVASLTKPWVDEDKILYFALTASPDMYTPPGYTFSVNIASEAFIYTLMKWIPENDPNFPKGRPAKIGLIGMEDPYVQNLLDGVKQYCDAHPTQWQYVKGFIVPWTQVTFPGEVEALKGCDYVVPPSTGFFLAQFIKEMRAAGSKATFLGTDAQAAYLGMMVDMAGWDQINGMILALPYTWWNISDADMVKKAKYCLETYHTADEQKELLWSGGSYRGGFTQWYGVMTIIKETIEKVGAQNFNSEALHDTAITFSEEFDGNVWNYSATDRQTWNSLRFYRADAAQKDLVSAGGLIPVVFAP